MIQHILVGYDGSEPSQHALSRAADLAKVYNARLTVLTAASDRFVRQDGTVTMAADEGHAREVAASGAAQARAAGVAQVDARASLEAPADAIVVTAKQEPTELVVVGHRGLGALKELFLGSTAKEVVDRVECSVLVVR